MKKTDLEKLNEQASKTAGVIKTHEAGIAYAKGQLMETASKVVVNADKVIKDAEIARGRATGILVKYGA